MRSRSASVLFAIPVSELKELSGITDAVQLVAGRVGLAGLGTLTGALLVLNALAGTASWTAGAARVPFAAGVDAAMPRAFAKLHPRYRTPHVALVVQSIAASASWTMRYGITLWYPSGTGFTIAATSSLADEPDSCSRRGVRSPRELVDRVEVPAPVRLVEERRHHHCGQRHVFGGENGRARSGQRFVRPDDRTDGGRAVGRGGAAAAVVVGNLHRDGVEGGAARGGVDVTPPDLETSAAAPTLR